MVIRDDSEGFRRAVQPMGVEKDSGLIHQVVTTPANAHQPTTAVKLLPDKEQLIYTDSGNRRIPERPAASRQGL